MRRRSILPLLLCLWPGLALGQTQSAGTKDKEPFKQDAKPCVSKEAAQEVLRLGRNLGYPDDEIVEAYGENPCATLSYLREEAQQKSSQPSSSSRVITVPAKEKQKEKQVTIRVVETRTGEREYPHTTPGTPGKSKTSCDTIGSDTYSTTDCTTTSYPSTPPVTETETITQKYVRAVMADGTHVVLWCQKALRRCYDLPPGDYSAEVNGNTAWVYAYDLSHKQHRIKYKMVGTW